MAKSPPRSRQIPMLFPLMRSSTGQAAKINSKAVRTDAAVSVSRDSRDAVIERLRRDGFFELRKKK
jgi:hypothetical protein